MGKRHNKQRRVLVPEIVQGDIVIRLEQMQAFSAQYALEAVLRYSEGLGTGPTFIRRSAPDTVNISWHWNAIPEGLPLDEVGPDLTVQIQYFADPIGKTTINHYYSPHCPDAKGKAQICTDARELLLIELQQKGLVKSGKEARPYV